MLGMDQTVREDAVRREFDKIEEEAGVAWLQAQLDYCMRPLLSEPWILDVDTTLKPLYGIRKVRRWATTRKTGRPSHSYHTCMLANLHAREPAAHSGGGGGAGK
jgi:hypothetical protein